jgi:hypothetical protein
MNQNLKIEVIFTFNGNNTTVKCDYNEKIKNILIDMLSKKKLVEIHCIFSMEVIQLMKN